MKSYMIIICPNAHAKLTKSDIMSSWSRFLRITRLAYRKLTKYEIRSLLLLKFGFIYPYLVQNTTEVQSQ